MASRSEGGDSIISVGLNRARTWGKISFVYSRLRASCSRWYSGTMPTLPLIFSDALYLHFAKSMNRSGVIGIVVCLLGIEWDRRCMVYMDSCGQYSPGLVAADI